jgi:membrane fusion protein (multidrug efflux system)
VLNNQRINKGDLIATIHDEDYKATLKAIESNINSSINRINIIEQKLVIGKISVAQNQELINFAQINLKNNSTDYARVQELNRDKFTSNKLFENTRTIFEKAKTDYSRAKLDLQITEQNLVLLELEKQAEKDTLQALIQNKNIAARALINTKIVAPISGILANSNMQIGNFALAGRILFSIVQDNIYVQANFKETQISKLRPDFKVKLQFDAIGDLVIYGTLRNMSPATGSKFSLIVPDNSTGNFTKVIQRVPILIDFILPKNINYVLIPGMSVKVSVRTDQ